MHETGPKVSYVATSFHLRSRWGNPTIWPHFTEELISGYVIRQVGDFETAAKSGRTQPCLNHGVVPS